LDLHPCTRSSLAARTALYDATAQAAKALNTEPALTAQLRAELTKTPPFPLTKAGAATSGK